MVSQLHAVGSAEALTSFKFTLLCWSSPFDALYGSAAIRVLPFYFVDFFCFSWSIL